MRIRRLELSGFKSFMERTVLELPAGITGIVGPNGCGKSNIVDAIRWVIGEQSAKHLRGDAMEDVICNGSSESGPLGMAEVSLLLSRDEAELAADGGDETPDGTGLPPELRRASEILVTRRYFRSGESEYLINRVPCRLRDITEFFLGTGVGTKAYAIIEQGRIEQIVNAKAADLRLFIEEAAGVTRFRTRRIAAERKLHRTRENLLRVQDVLRELDRQRALLERQARRAEEFHRLRGELRELDLRVMSSRYGEWTTTLATMEGELARLRRAEVQLQEDIHDRVDSTAEARTRRLGLESEIDEVDTEVADQRVAAREAATRAEGLAARGEDIRTRSREASRLGGELRARLAKVQADIVRLQDEVRALGLAEAEARAGQGVADQRLRELASSGPALEAAVEVAKDAVLSGLSAESRLRSMIEALGQRRSDIEGRRQRVDMEQRQLGERLRANGQAAAAVREGLERVGGRQRDAGARRIDLATARDRQLAEARRAEEALELARGNLARVRSRADSLRELQLRREGCTRGVATVLSREGGSAVLLADVLRVPVALERAVAAALGTRLAQPVVENADAALEVVSWLEREGGGSATVLPRDSAARVPPIVVPGRRLLDDIEVDPRFWGLAEALLGRVLVADTLEAAVAVWQGAAREVTVVTPAGEAVDAVGAIAGGSEPPLEETLLARTRELRELTAQEEMAAAEADSCLKNLSALRESLAHADGGIAQLDEQLGAFRLERVALEKDKERLDQNHGQLTAELEIWALEASGLAGADDEMSQELAALEQQGSEAQRQLAECRGELAAAQDALSCWRSDHEQAEEARTAAAVTVTACSERWRGTDAELERQREACSEVTARLTAAERDLDEATATANAVEIERLSVLALQVASEAQVAEVTSRRDAIRAALAAAEAALAADDQLLQERRVALESCREERGRLEVGSTERRLAIDHLLEQLTERYELGPEALTASNSVALSEGAPEEEAQRAERLRARLAQLGDVNPGAVKELEELRGRHEFLVAQREDLERSLEDLRRTIAKLVRASEERFEETFADANSKLAEVFPRLFPDGKARLQLTTPQEGEDPGVEIVVQPAGKKLQHLSLLSGGEKALTATALVLALFLIRPTPFCLLDEVDAPLDEANIGRFNQVVREMAETCQFVLITHNRRTMEAADTLYGITMEQPGVSKVVSVKLREAA